jgi:hypothetical protein
MAELLKRKRLRKRFAFGVVVPFDCHQTGRLGGRILTDYQFLGARNHHHLSVR